MTPMETVQNIYAAFGRGDLPAILATLAEDIDWEHDTFPNDVPWMQPLKGRDQVPRFFQALAEQVTFNSFKPTRVIADGDLVIALCDVDYVVRATGKRVVEIDEVHLWRFNAQGRACRFRHRVDTLQIAQARMPGD